MNYTLAVGIALLVALAYDLRGARTRLVTRRSFWTAYAIVLGFQLLVNGVLTGLKVVRYDRSRIIGLRIAYAPVEDLAFGFSMVLITLATWVWLGRRAARAAPSAGRATPPQPGAAPRR